MTFIYPPLDRSLFIYFCVSALIGSAAKTFSVIVYEVDEEKFGAIAAANKGYEINEGRARRDERSSEAAMAGDWSLSRYDILPDRIVLYMWSKAGGTKFNFKFRPRYGINAQTPASVVYDYYNPEARATVMPLRFAAK